MQIALRAKELTRDSYKKASVKFLRLKCVEVISFH